MPRRRRDPIHSDQIGRPSAPEAPRPGDNYLDLAIAEQHDVAEYGAASYRTPYSAYLSLPQLRGFWPLSSVDEVGNAYDVSGQGRTVFKNGTLSYALQDLTPYVDFNATGYLNRSDEAGLSPTSNVTFGAWIYLNSGFSDVIFIGKHGASGGGQMSFGLQALTVTGTPRIQLHISDNGTSEETTYLEPTEPTDTWNFIVGRFNDVGGAVIYCNGQRSEVKFNAVSIFDATTAFQLGVSPYTGGTTYLDGRMAFPFIAAAEAPDTMIAHLFKATRAIFGR